MSVGTRLLYTKNTFFRKYMYNLKTKRVSEDYHYNEILLMPQHPPCAKHGSCLFLLLMALACSAKGQGYQLPPKIISTFKNEYFYPRDSTLTDASFNCTAQNGQIQYEWKKDGVVVENSQYVSIDNSTGTLNFVKMQNGDYGIYQCFATNDNGTSLSKPFKVKEASLESFPASSIQEVQCKQYEHCKVRCRHKPRCVPDSQCNVRWRIGEGTNTHVQIDKRVAVDSNGDLHFLWTDLNDWTGLPYFCEVSHEQLDKPVVGSQTTLRIDKASMALEIDPFSVFKEDGKTLVGGKGVLRCMFSGYPVPDIEWTSPQQTIIKTTSSKYEISDSGRVLTILQSHPENEGFYICLGKAKTESRPQNVSLNVTSAPVLIGDNQMRDTIVTEGNNATFSCETMSLPKELPPTPPLWKKNGVNLEFDEEKYILRENNQVLTVTDVQKSDTGVYQCMSENSEGVLLKEAILKVLDPLRTEVSAHIITTNIAYDNITTTGATLTTTVIQTETKTAIYIIAVFAVVLIIILILISIFFFRRKKKHGTFDVKGENGAYGLRPEQTPLRTSLLNNHEYDYKDEKNDFDDDDDSLGEYAGDLGLNKFNEDGSFIGLYANKKDKKTPKSESDV